MATIEDYEIPEVEEKKETEEEDHFFAPYMRDVVAENPFENIEPIVLNWGNVCDVDLIEEDKNILCPSKDKWIAKGYVFHKWLVDCPVHTEKLGGHFKVLFFEVPKNKQLGKCPYCITDEINRVIRERTIRDEKIRKEKREEEKNRRR